MATIRTEEDNERMKSAIEKLRYEKMEMLINKRKIEKRGKAKRFYAEICCYLKLCVI